MTKWDLLNTYINHMVEKMDMDDVLSLAMDQLYAEYKNHSQEQIMQEITEWYPELLEEINDHK